MRGRFGGGPPSRGRTPQRSEPLPLPRKPQRSEPIPLPLSRTRSTPMPPPRFASKNGFAAGGMVGSGMTGGAGGGLGRIEKSDAAAKGYKKGGMVKKGKC